MYFSVNARTNTVLLNVWKGKPGSRIRVSIPVKTYEQPGRAMEVLRLSRQRDMAFECVMARLLGKETMTEKDIHTYITSQADRRQK